MYVLYIYKVWPTDHFLLFMFINLLGSSCDVQSLGHQTKPVAKPLLDKTSVLSTLREPFGCVVSHLLHQRLACLCICVGFLPLDPPLASHGHAKDKQGARTDFSPKVGTLLPPSVSTLGRPLAESYSNTANANALTAPAGR